MKPKTIYEFRHDIDNTFGFTAMSAFWFRVFYEKYRAGVITYEDALEKLKRMSNYTGV